MHVVRDPRRVTLCDGNRLRTSRPLVLRMVDRNLDGNS